MTEIYIDDFAAYDEDVAAMQFEYETRVRSAKCATCGDTATGTANSLEVEGWKFDNRKGDRCGNHNVPYLNFLVRKMEMEVALQGPSVGEAAVVALDEARAVLAAAVADEERVELLKWAKSVAYGKIPF